MNRRILGLMVAAGLVVACESPLDTNPTASIDAETALNTTRGIELALNGAYRQLQTDALYGRQELSFSDMYTDNLNFTGTFTGDREVSVRAIQPNNTEVGGIWSGAYTGINRSNYVLDAIPTASDMTDAKAKQLRGEALWLRALYHSVLVKYYGGVPLVDQPSKGIDANSYPARATLAESYAFIAKDLEEASLLLGPARNTGRATRAAADGLLARIYLEMGDNAKARDKATAVINSGLYTLVADFRSFFTSKNSSESIYEVQFTTTNTNSTSFWFFPTALGGRLGFAPSTDLFNAFEAGDARRDASIATSGTQRYAFKYYRIASRDDNIPVVRLAEMYLIRAEANARLGAAVATVAADINVIRTRAKLGNLSASVTTQQGLLDAILQERRVELAFEGFRLMDLRRHGKATAILGVSADRLLWPIPQYEVDVNKSLKQNPGY
jgi:starch-binding outer membrane protein, SusD/RagB family